MSYYLVCVIVWLVVFFIWTEFWKEMDNVTATYCGNITNPVWYISYIMLVCLPFIAIASYGLAMLSIDS